MENREKNDEKTGICEGCSRQETCSGNHGKASQSKGPHRDYVSVGSNKREVVADVVEWFMRGPMKPEMFRGASQSLMERFDKNATRDEREKACAVFFDGFHRGMSLAIELIESGALELGTLRLEHPEG